MAVLCRSASSSLHSMMNETMMVDGPLVKNDPFYLDSASHWSNGGGGGGGGGGGRGGREDPVRSYTMLTKHSVQQFYNTTVFSSTHFHAAQMTLNNTKISELDADDVSLDSWQKTHPEQWTCEDVLNLIYFIALKSNDIEFASLHGEKFQNVAGAELCSMTEKDFVLRDSKYGKMLYQCVRTLLEKSQFLPPDDIVFVKKEKPDNCLTSVRTEIPRPVEELSFEESNDDFFDDDKQNVISLFGINYDIDSAADFGNIQPTTDVIASTSTSSSTSTPSSSVSSSSSTTSPSSLPSGVCADTTCMDVDQKVEADATTYDSNYAYHMNLYPNYHNAHHQQHHQQQQQGLHHERSRLVPDSTVGSGGGTPFPIDLRRNHETESVAGDLLWSQGERKTKRRRNKSNSSDGEESSNGNSSQIYQDVNRQSNSVGKNHLWEFLCQLLMMSESIQAKDRVIQWESREEGVFRIIDSKEVASLWGKHKGNEKMTYEKLSRALRWCRTFGFLAALPKDGKFPKKLCFRFGPRATNWRHFV